MSKNMAKMRDGVISGGLSGRTGNAVFVASPHGTLLRGLPFSRDPATAAQRDVRDRIRRAGLAWRHMSHEQAARWNAFARELEGPGDAPALNGQQIFTQLSVRYLAIHDGQSMPLDPPAGPFPGDAVRFAVSVGPGRVVVTADRSNAEEVVTEVLLQPLKSRHRRTYLERYRTAAFHAFAEDAPWSKAVRPGFYAVATRFLRASTGQATPLIEWGVVQA